ncbi:unnamed protein product [Arctia plantaginis]|uniref:Androgen-dependent TFPI-regulating protein-like n=1 Tax=Arctia plantaginis TaxID=874455 RepID=A0A8S1A697_ARCPL|nr:unnamed protein product [Arctia plantaginis]
MSRRASRHFSDPKYVRMFGYIVTLAMHTLNAIYMVNIYKDEALKDPHVGYFWKYQFRMLTFWNTITQCFYAILGLSCDILSLSNEGNDTSLLKTLRGGRDLLFSAILFPISLGVCILFWSLYAYSPNILMPLTVQKLLPWISNHVIHTFIVPVVLWEAVCLPRKLPASHLLNLTVLNVHNVTFIAVLFLTLFESGQFPYPLLNMIYGTPCFIMFLVSCFILHNLSYKLQWYITDFIYGNREDGEEIKKVR